MVLTHKNKQKKKKKKNDYEEFDNYYYREFKNKAKNSEVSYQNRTIMQLLSNIQYQEPQSSSNQRMIPPTSDAAGLPPKRVGSRGPPKAPLTAPPKAPLTTPPTAPSTTPPTAPPTTPHPSSGPYNRGPRPPPGPLPSPGVPPPPPPPPEPMRNNLPKRDGTVRPSMPTRRFLSTEQLSRSRLTPAPTMNYSSSVNAPGQRDSQYSTQQGKYQTPQHQVQEENAWYKAKSYMPVNVALKKRLCPRCGSKGFDINEMEDKTRIISYVPRRIYAKKYVCKKCRFEF